MTTTKFPLGQIVATPGAIEAMEESGQAADFFLDQHRAEIGESLTPRIGSNDQALVDGTGFFRPT